jgi:hypothetical protein
MSLDILGKCEGDIHLRNNRLDLEVVAVDTGAKQGSLLISHILLLSWRLFSCCLRAPGAQLRTLIEELPVGMNRASGDYAIRPSALDRRLA